MTTPDPPIVAAAVGETADRRPIRARETNPARWLAARLIGWRVSANAISAASMGFAAAAAACLLLTLAVEGDVAHALLFLGAAAGIQMRLLCKLLDGMVAIGSGTSSPTGELWNDLPDRVSDSLVLIAFGAVAGSSLVLGLVAALLAMFTACVRLAGRTAGASSAWCGPMAKPHRMALLTAVAVALTVPAVADWRPFAINGTAVGLPAIALALVSAGCVVTVFRRLRRIRLELASRPSDPQELP